MIIPIGELIKRTLKFYQDHFKTIVKYILLNAIPTFLSFVISFSVAYSATLLGTYNPTILYLLVPLFFVIFIVVFVLSMWFNFALIKELYQIYNQNLAFGVKTTLSETKHLIWKGICTSVVSGLYSSWLFLTSIIILLVKLFLLPKGLPTILNYTLNALIVISFLAGIVYLLIYGIKLSFSVFETILGNKNVRESISTSKELTKNRWWEVTARIIVPGLLIYVALGIINSIFSGIGKLIGDYGTMITGIINMITNLLAAPIGLIVGIILYQEVKKTPANTSEITQ